jgi:hypothetical protein
MLLFASIALLGTAEYIQSIDALQTYVIIFGTVTDDTLSSLVLRR